MPERLQPVYDEDLSNLDEWLRRLKVEYDIFFNGHRKRPPEDLRARVDKVVKKLVEATDMSFSQRFRYNTLVSRYYVYRDLWRRTMKERENSEEAARELSAEIGPDDSAKATDPSPIEIQVSIANPEKEEDKVRQLYDALLQIRETHSPNVPGLSFEKFVKYISTQTDGIRVKYACSSVLYKVRLEENAIRFTAAAEF
jgi:hypothetical protein